MNKVILMGRLTRDPEIRYSQGTSTGCIARYTLAVNRRFKTADGPEADFINCVVFGKGAEFAEKYLHQGMKIVVIGRIQTGSYINRDNQKVYTTDIVIEEQEFAEKKSVSENNTNRNQYPVSTPNPASTPPADNPVPYSTTPAPMPWLNPTQTAVPNPMSNQTTMEMKGFMRIPDGIEEDIPFN